MKHWLLLQRLAPGVGLLVNFLRHRRLHCGIRVEIQGPGNFQYGSGVGLGEGTRIELPLESSLVVDDRVAISRHVHIVPEKNHRVHVGEATTIQDGCRIYGNVAIGPQCILAPNVFISSGTHAFESLPELSIQQQDVVAPVATDPIRIFGDCWFGINAVVTPGVTIGRGCVIGANSVVTHDLPPYSVAAGNPARVLRQRLEFAPKARIDARNGQDARYFYDGFDVRTAVTQGYTARGQFILALHHHEPQVLRLCVSGDAGDISFDGSRQPLPVREAIIEFPCDSQSALLPFLQFQCTGRCNVHWAELT